MFTWIKSLFASKPVEAHYTTDGGHLAPYPGMTDSDLEAFERHFNVPNPTF